MEGEIGARVRARIDEVSPRPTQAQLASTIGMTPDAFSRALNGKRAFTATELVELARVLSTSAHWFVTGESDPLAMRVAGRHNFDHDTTSYQHIDWEAESGPLADVALAYVQAYSREPRIPYPPSAPSAGTVREKLAENGGPGFIRALAEVIEQTYGIDVVRLSGVSRGFAIEIVGRRVIVIGETGNWFYENWSLAHELSHALRGEFAGVGDEDPVVESSDEMRANAFAADLLLPAALLATVDWATASRSDVAAFVWSAGVSTDALSRRLRKKNVRVSAEAESALSMKTQALIRAHWSSPERVDEMAARMEVAATRRFPIHLIAVHRDRAAAGEVRPATLAWMLGVDEESLAAEVSPSPDAADLAWLEEELRGTADPT
jgi:Zn-dependent peptidase ImmA (M78 family)/transcriptional regulator with XRE-family HTH domain